VARVEHVGFDFHKPVDRGYIANFSHSTSIPTSGSYIGTFRRRRLYVDVSVVEVLVVKAVITYMLLFVFSTCTV
jgi:hypothetical protein